jgi:hypothetical protein
VNSSKPGNLERRGFQKHRLKVRHEVSKTI